MYSQGLRDLLKGKAIAKRQANILGVFLTVLVIALLSSLVGCQLMTTSSVPTSQLASLTAMPTPESTLVVSTRASFTPTPFIAQATPSVLSTIASSTLTVTPFIAPLGFSTDIYPSPSPVAEGIVLGLSAGCPNSTGLEKATQLSFDTALDVLKNWLSGDLDRMRHATDPAYWPLLNPEGSKRLLRSEELGVPQPANASPYAELIANGCGKQIMGLSWWVTICPGPCQDPAVSRNPSLIGHIYLIERKGHWLVWAAR